MENLDFLRQTIDIAIDEWMEAQGVSTLALRSMDYSSLDNELTDLVERAKDFDNEREYELMNEEEA